MFCASISDSIEIKNHCSKCLYVEKKINMQDRQDQNETHRIIFQATSEMLCTNTSKFIHLKNQCGECLFVQEQDE